MLTRELLADYCRRYPDEGTGELAARFGVSDSYIRRLKREARAAGLLERSSSPPAAVRPRRFRRVDAPRVMPRRRVALPVAPRCDYWLCPHCHELRRPPAGVELETWNREGCGVCSPVENPEPEPVNIAPQRNDPAPEQIFEPEQEAELDAGTIALQSHSSAVPVLAAPPVYRVERLVDRPFWEQTPLIEPKVLIALVVAAVLIPLVFAGVRHG